jgi:hypothetical protein
MNYDFELGERVICPKYKEWGIGQIQSIIKQKITINFENVGKKVIKDNSILIEKYIENAN